MRYALRHSSEFIPRPRLYRLPSPPFVTAHLLFSPPPKPTPMPFPHMIPTNLSPSTPLLQDWLGGDEAKRHRREVHFPTGRFGEAIEQAQAVLFLASDESSFVNGTDFVVDGGMTRCYITPEGPPTEPPKNYTR